MTDEEREAELRTWDNPTGGIVAFLLARLDQARRERSAAVARAYRAETDADDKVQALAAVSTILTSSQPVPKEWNRYGAVFDARAAVARAEKAERERDEALQQKEWLREALEYVEEAWRADWEGGT